MRDNRKYTERRLPQTELKIVTALEKRGATSSKDLARRIEEKWPQKVSMSLRFLKDQSIIATSNDKEDGRLQKCDITPLGSFVLSVVRDFMNEVQQSRFIPVEWITPQDILRFTSNERTRNKALLILGRWIEKSKSSLKKLGRARNGDTEPFKYSPIRNVDDDGFFKDALGKYVKLDAERCIPHSTSMEGINRVLDRHQDGISTSVRTAEELIDKPETMSDLTLLGIFGPASRVYYFELPSAGEADPINCPRGTTVRKRFSEELSKEVSSESRDELELCVRHIKGEYSRIVGIIDSKAWLQTTGRVPRLTKSYDKMVIINRSRVEKGDASVKKLVKHRYSIHNCFSAEEWKWKVSLDYAITQLPRIMDKMFDGYCDDSA